MDEYELERARENYRAYCEHVCSTEREEVVRGMPVAPLPRGQWDGLLAFDAYFWIETYLQQRPRGRAFRPAPPFLLRAEPLTVRVPDVAFIEAHRLAQHAWRGLCPVVPDLIVDVVSQAERVAEVEARIADFFVAGTRMAWLIDARTKTCTVLHSRGKAQTFGYNDKVRSAPVLPHFNFHVYELFGE